MNSTEPPSRCIADPIPGYLAAYFLLKDGTKRPPVAAGAAAAAAGAAAVAAGAAALSVAGAVLGVGASRGAGAAAGVERLHRSPSAARGAGAAAAAGAAELLSESAAPRLLGGT